MPWLKSPLAQIIGLALVMAVLQPIAALSLLGSPVSALLWSYVLPLTIVQWTAADMREHRRTPCFDYCFLMLLGWPVSMIWYTIWTRGLRGVLFAFGLYALCWLPYFSTAIVWTAWQVVASV